MLLLAALALVLSTLGLANGEPDVLTFEPTTGSFYTNQLDILGYSYKAATAAEWASYTFTDFKKYKAIVIGDPWCSGDVDYSLSTPLANRATWSAAADGNIIVLGTDENLHDKALVAEYGMKYAAESPAGKTGLYISLSCYYWYVSTDGGTPIPVLDAFTTAGKAILATGVPGCFNDAHIVAVHPAVAGLSDAYLSDWWCSVHNAFSSFPAEFIPLAIARTTSGTGVLTFADASVGIPYILARGEALSPIKCGDGVKDATEECDDGNTVPNDGCSEKCQEESCGDGIKQTGEQCDLGAGRNGVGTGCNADCILEGCGNGMIEALLGETCDDGNSDSCDGCDSLCHIECGNGKVECTEECDDGGLLGGDGCDSACKKECGNGALDAGEQCDDGNRIDADGCSSTCSLENMVPDCAGGRAEIATIWPPNHEMASFAIVGIVDPDNDPLTVTVTRIEQNEATQLNKGDKFCPDASIPLKQIRLERGGQSDEKNGRTYRISFTAEDGKGGICSGTTLLCIPHDQNHNCHAHDPEFVDSTECHFQCPSSSTPTPDQSACICSQKGRSWDAQTNTCKVSPQASVRGQAIPKKRRGVLETHVAKILTQGENNDFEFSGYVHLFWSLPYSSNLDDPLPLGATIHYTIDNEEIDCGSTLYNVDGMLVRSNSGGLTTVRGIVCILTEGSPGDHPEYEMSDVTEASFWINSGYEYLVYVTVDSAGDLSEDAMKALREVLAADLLVDPSQISLTATYYSADGTQQTNVLTRRRNANVGTETVLQLQITLSTQETKDKIANAAVAQLNQALSTICPSCQVTSISATSPLNQNGGTGSLLPSNGAGVDGTKSDPMAVNNVQSAVGKLDPVVLVYVLVPIVVALLVVLGVWYWRKRRVLPAAKFEQDSLSIAEFFHPSVQQSKQSGKSGAGQEPKLFLATDIVVAGQSLADPVVQTQPHHPQAVFSDAQKEGFLMRSEVV